MSNKPELTECEDDLNRYHAQTEGMIVALTNGSPDYFDGVQSSVIFDVLWLLQDRIQDIKNTADKVVAIAKEGAI